MESAQPTKGRLLVIDDDDSFRPALRDNLVAMGYTVQTAANGQDGLKIFLEGNFDAIISDIRMPHMDGIELTRYVRGSSKAIPVILITGFSGILQTKEAYELGASEFLTKPIQRKELVAALNRCIGSKEITESDDEAEQDLAYCKLGIEDFASGRQIQFNIFMQLSPDKYVKIAHSGEDLSTEKMQSYQAKGIFHLYLRKRDFRTYVGFTTAGIKPTPGVTKEAVSFEKRAKLLKKTEEVLFEFSKHEGLHKETYSVSSAFVQTTVEILSEDADVFKLLEYLNSHSDYMYAHSVGVSLYSVMLARAVSWGLPTNKFKVAVGGLLHDVGERDLPKGLSAKPRHTWSPEDAKAYESHPYRSMEILGMIRSIPSDVLHIAKEHHESCLADGYPGRMTRSAVHPMAKLVTVADEFCERVIKGPNGEGMSPQEALKQMKLTSADRYDTQFFEALNRLFTLDPTGSFSRGRSPRPKSGTA